MGKISNILFSVIFIVFLLGPLGYVLADKVIPDFDRPVHSYQEGRTYQTFPEHDVNALAKGKFQNEFERYVSDAVPFRDSVLVANSVLQRQSILAGNIVHQFPALPTNFNSDYSFCPTTSSVVENPAPFDKQAKARLDACATALNSCIDANPDVDFCVAVVDRSDVSLASPAHDLINDPLDYNTIRDAFYTQINERCATIDLSYDDANEYYENYFRTDHHWTPRGAFEAYKKIIPTFNVGEPVEGEFREVFPGPWYGASARLGLFYDFGDSYEDVFYKPSKLSVAFNGKKQPTETLAKSLKPESMGEYSQEEQGVGAYVYYTHSDTTLITVTNDSLKDGQSLLIVGDSFTNCAERFYAEHYHEVYILDPRKTARQISETLEKYDIDDCLIMLSSSVLFNQSVAKKFKS